MREIMETHYALSKNITVRQNKTEHEIPFICRRPRLPQDVSAARSRNNPDYVNFISSTSTTPETETSFSGACQTRTSTGWPSKDADQLHAAQLISAHMQTAHGCYSNPSASPMPNPLPYGTRRERPSFSAKKRDYATAISQWHSATPRSSLLCSTA
ncbi:MAG: hypothetical protein ACLRMJ_05640 [Alistipes finegoldii]